jgi:toxin HigB-1
VVCRITDTRFNCGLRSKGFVKVTTVRRQVTRAARRLGPKDKKNAGGGLSLSTRQKTVSLQAIVIRRDIVTGGVINGRRYYQRIVIRSFSDSKTAQVFNRIRVSKWSKDVQRQALRKLLIIDAAENVEDLRVPPGNRLERLKGGRKGQYSIRINDQWRICFKWSSGNATDVEIVDYHKG